MIAYSKGTGAYENWLLGEEEFLLQHQGKGESILHLSNGYLGIRSAYEESYPYQTRGMFAAGCFDRHQEDSAELPNVADTCEVRIFLDGCLFSMVQGKLLKYGRYLNLYTGELRRDVEWESPEAKRYSLTFRRCVSKDDVHAYGMQISITPWDMDAAVSVESGINARMTNSGVQHFGSDAQKVLPENLLYLEHRTMESGIAIYHCCGSNMYGADKPERSFSMKRKLLQEKLICRIPRGQTGQFEKLAVLYTDRDKELEDKSGIQQMIGQRVRQLRQLGYEKLFRDNADKMRDYWNQNDVVIHTENGKLQLAVRFAQYHLLGMVPNDNRSSIAAKGLSGEGYKGHVFWDTEVFMLPYFMFTDAPKARRLLEYRIARMVQAARNASEKGYRGLMYPWESAETGEEETPLFASMDIKTGKAAPVWAGLKEHHITADIAYAVWTYYLTVKDEDLMEKGGAELLIGSALFWHSRSVFSDVRQRYELLDIIGPDEYTEHVDNNAYTNYMAFYVTQKAVKLLGSMEKNKVREIEERFGEKDLMERLTDFMERLYLPKPFENGVLPQDDSFMNKSLLDIGKYRQDSVKQTILKSYSREQVNDMQVLKQADAVMLLVLWPELLDIAVKKATWEYYEPKTIHDSSLSQAVYSIAASDNGEAQKAYESFLEAVDIDMGPNPYSSNEGIHAAAMGGIWMAVIRGFAGVRVTDEGMVIQPCLPDEIKGLDFQINIWNKRIHVVIRPDEINLYSDSNDILPVIHRGRRYELERELKINKV